MPSDDAIPKIDHDFQPLQDGVQLGSMIHFRRLFDHLLRAAKPKMICEIGIEGGIVSDFLVARAGEIGARYVGIDPFLSQSVAHRLANPSVEFHTHRSLDVLPRLPCPDFTIIDGDHNYYTVMGELRLLREAWRREGEPQILILMHDTSWPCARRDFYYNVWAIPSEHRHETAAMGGLSVHSAELTPHGYAQGENFSIARDWGGPRNGVLTALEDFLCETPAFAAVHVPAVCGLSVIYPAGSLSELVRNAINELRNGLSLFGDLLAQLEYNRLFAYELFRREHFRPKAHSDEPTSSGSHEPNSSDLHMFARRLVDRAMQTAHLIRRSSARAAAGMRRLGQGHRQ